MASNVMLYDTFEVAVSSDREYANPFDYEEVALSGKFESPDGKAYKVTGFYDGIVDQANTWRLRFMPMLPGEWKYWVSSLDDSPETSGRFTVGNRPRGESNHGHVSVDEENSGYLVHDDGSPHYWVGGKWVSARDYGPRQKEGEMNAGVDPSKVKFGWKSDEQLIRYLELLAEYKHNGILLKIGLYPLEKDGISWDLEWIQRGEWLVKEALERGIYVQVNIFDTWSKHKDFWFQNNMDGAGQPFNVWVDGDDQKKRNYIRTIVSRFSGFPNVYWELGNEMEHSPNCGECFVELSNEKYIPWIRDADPYDLPIGLSEEIWRNANVDIGFLHQANVLEHSSWTKPVIMNELVRYDRPPSLMLDLYNKLPWRIRSAYKKHFGEITHRGLWQDGAINDPGLRFTYRRAFWNMFVHGGVGASEATWLYIDDQYSDAVHHVMRDHMHLASVVEKYSNILNKMRYMNDAVVLDDVEVNTRGIEGEVYIAYFDAGHGRHHGAGDVAITLPQGSYSAAWYNTKSGATDEFDIDANGVEVVLKSPLFKEDIVLIVSRTSNTN